MRFFFFLFISFRVSSFSHFCAACDKPERSFLDDCASGRSSTGSSLKRLMISGHAARSRRKMKEKYIARIYTRMRENAYVSRCYLSIHARSHRLIVLTVSRRPSPVCLIIIMRSEFCIGRISTLR